MHGCRWKPSEGCAWYLPGKQLSEDDLLPLTKLLMGMVNETRKGTIMGGDT